MRKSVYSSGIFVLCFLSVMALLIGLTGCTGYEPFFTGGFSGGYSKIEVFIGACFWDGGDRTIRIPDEYDGKRVTVLGGYSGIGCPDPFMIILNDKDYDLCASTVADEGDIYETLVFTVKIGKNIKEIKNVDGELYWGIEGEKDGEWYFDIMYKVAYRFKVDSRNKAYYSYGGKLYRKRDKMLLPFFYE